MSAKRNHPRPGSRQQRPTDWGGVAEWYDQLVGDEGSEFHRAVVFPKMLRLLDPQPRQRVLDVACGQGAFCRLLAERGCDVTGIDAATDLIAAANGRQASPDPGTKPPGSIRYLVGDARDLSRVEPAHFHAAVCILAIQNIHPIAPVFEGVARVLLPGAKFVLVMMHPCFRGHKESSWGWDEQAGVQFRRVDRYLVPRKSPIYAHPGKKDGAYTWSFHKPIEDYVKAMTKSGLLIDAIEEWPSHKKSDSGPRARAENIAREEIPMFMAIRGIRPQHPTP